MLLALFVAFAVVFAPGVDQGSGAPQTGRDLAAHMLAPSVSEGAVQDVRSAVEEALAGLLLRIARGAFHLAALTAALCALAWLLALRRAASLEDGPRCLCGPPLRAPPALAPA